MAVYLSESPAEDLAEALKNSGYEVRRVLVCESCGVVYDPEYAHGYGSSTHSHTSND